MAKCIDYLVPDEACNIVFKAWDDPKTRTRSKQIGTTARGEMMIADYDADGRILSIELVEPGIKPCQQSSVTASGSTTTTIPQT